MTQLRGYSKKSECHPEVAELKQKYKDGLLNAPKPVVTSPVKNNSSITDFYGPSTSKEEEPKPEEEEEEEVDEKWFDDGEEEEIVEKEVEEEKEEDNACSSEGEGSDGEIQKNDKSNNKSSTILELFV